MIRKAWGAVSPLAQGALIGIGVVFAAVPLSLLLWWWVEFWIRVSGG